MLGDAFGVPVERRMLGQVAVLVGLVLGQDLVDDQLLDPHAHQRQGTQRPHRLGGHHPLGGQHQVRGDQLAVGQQGAQPVDAAADALQQFHHGGRARVVAGDGQPAMARPRALHVEPKSGRQGQHSQRVRGRGAVDDDAVPSPGGGELADGVQPQHLLNTRQRRKFFGRNVTQLGIGKPPIQRVDHAVPPGLEQRQGVQRQRVKETAAGLRVIGEHPNRFAVAARRHRDAQHVAQRVRLVGGHDQNPPTRARVADRGGGGQGGLSYPALPDEKTDPGRGGCPEVTGLTQPRLVSSDPSKRCQSACARPCA